MAPIADNVVMQEIQYHMLESPDLGVTWSDGLWDQAEVLAYINERQNRFLKEAPVLLGRADITPSGGLEHDLPADWMITYRLLWRDDNGDRIELPRVDHAELDYALQTWPAGTAAQPAVYADTDPPTLKIQVAPIPTNSGTFEILYVPNAGEMDGDGSGVFLTPEEFVSYIKYGAMADMFSKNGRAHNPAMAAYCEERFSEGVQMVLALVNGLV